jgi:YYY domain-containing protein
MILVALTAGTARAASLWNMPALGILLVSCGALRPTGGKRLPRPGPAAIGGLVGLALFFLSLALFWPYTASFHLVNQGIGRADLTSGMLEMLGVWGILFAVGAVALWPAAREDSETGRRRRDLFLVGAGAAALLIALWDRAPGLSLVLFVGCLAARAGWQALRSASPEGDPDALFAAFLILLALGMIAGCEVVYFKDNYGHDLQRMNTIFKFYHQAWPLLAIGSSVFAGRAWRTAAAKRPVLRAVIVAATILALLWPINVVVSRFRQKDGPLSLDARGPLARRSPGDAAAIEWLIANAPVKSVVMEATEDPYSEFARISSHTGIPTVLGWANHEGLWRSNDPEVAERAAWVRRFYTTPDARVAWETIQKFRVTHVVVGGMERRTYPSADAVANLPFLAPVAGAADTTIYAVVRPQ